MSAIGKDIPGFRSIRKMKEPYVMPEGMDSLCWECEYAQCSSNAYWTRGTSEPIVDRWACGVYTRMGIDSESVPGLMMDCPLKDKIRDRLYPR